MGRYDCEFSGCCAGWVSADKAGGSRGDERRPCPKCGGKGEKEEPEAPVTIEEIGVPKELEGLDECTICEKLGQTYPQWGDICASCAVSKAMMMLKDALKELGHDG